MENLNELSEEGKGLLREKRGAFYFCSQRQLQRNLADSQRAAKNQTCGGFAV